MRLDVITNKLNAGYAGDVCQSVEARIQAVLSSIQAANGKALPTNFDAGQKPSGSPAKSICVINKALGIILQKVPTGGFGRVQG
jgi:hypothetical protein